MDDPMLAFTKSARDLSKNPLGIIALFIVMVYGFACLLFGFSAEILEGTERVPLIWFVITFPVIVLFLFGWLVSQHHNKLYSPRDFRDDKSFLESLNQPSVNEVKSIGESEKNIADIMEAGKEFEITDDLEKNIRDDLKFRNVNHDGETADLLIHSLAIAQANTWFERIYRVIFGSQIALLKKLDGDSDGISSGNMASYFEETQAANPEPFHGWNASQYKKYLLDIKFIEPKGDHTIITRKGSDFLKILSINGYSEDKSF